jgi:hypothetical protein
MKTELRVNAQGAVELWHDGKPIGALAGSEGPGVQVISPYPMLPQWHAHEVQKWVEIRIASEPATPTLFPPSITREW